MPAARTRTFARGIARSLGRVRARLARHPWRVAGALALLALGVWSVAGRIGSRAPVVAAYHHVVDELGVRLVEGHADAIHAAARESGVSPSLLASIVYAESRGRGGQTSRTGALGLGQLAMSSARDAARRLGLAEPTEEEVRDDDALNLRLAACHLAWLLRSSPDWPLEQVLVSYNSGRARLFQWLERSGGFEAWVRDEEARRARGEATTGSLAYARQVLAIRERFVARGKLADVAKAEAP